jgi:hypothetical protein
VAHKKPRQRLFGGAHETQEPCSRSFPCRHWPRARPEACERQVSG